MIFLTFSIFSTQLFRNEQLLNAMLSIYLLLSVAIIDICFEIKQSESRKIRAIYWIILDALVSLVLGIYFSMKDDVILSSVVIIWMILSTITNIISVKRES